MSLSTTIATGTLLGGLLAAGVYAATAPSDQLSATVPVAPTFGPVPTPTITHVAKCVKPASLEHGVCVTHVPGPTITLPALPGPARVEAAAPRTSTTSSRPAATRTVPPATVTPPTGPTTGDDGGDDEHDDDHGDDHHGDDHDDD